MMNQLAHKLFEANQKAFNYAENPLRSHGPDHHLRVYNFAVSLAKKLSVPCDEDVLAGAALLHDLAAYYPKESGEQYHDFDGRYAHTILMDINFPKHKISAVLHAISNHGSDERYKSDKEPIETTIVRDADKLDVFGPIGVARILMVRTLKGDTLEQIVTDFYYGGHLQRKWDSITLEETRSIAKDDFEYSMSFFSELGRKLNLS